MKYDLFITFRMELEMQERLSVILLLSPYYHVQLSKINFSGFFSMVYDENYGKHTIVKISMIQTMSLMNGHIQCRAVENFYDSDYAINTGWLQRLFSVFC